MIKSFYYLIIIFAFVFLFGCFFNKSSLTQVNTIFEVSEGNSLILMDNKSLPDTVLGKTDTLFGVIYDTGVLNLFNTYNFDGENIYVKRFYIKERIYKESNPSLVRIIGGYSKVDFPYEEIEVYEIKKLDDIDKQIEEAKRYVSYYVVKNRTFYNLNNYKNTNRFKKAFNDFKSLDLNKTKFVPNSDLVFIDFKKMIIGIDCGKNIIRENVQRGDYLTYLAIYDLNKEKLVKVIIKNTGYFLE